MNGSFNNGDKTSTRLKLVLFELLNAFLKRMQEKISTRVINVYDDSQQSNIVFAPILQEELLRIAAL